MREFAEMFYKSQAWRETRKAYAKAKAGLCERCLRRGIYAPGEIVHHKIYLTPENITNPEVALSWDNLELLCRDCHGKVHRGYEPRYTVDKLGRVTVK